MSSVSPGLPAVARCPAHPARPAVDRCPVCARARCGADAATFARRGCSLCAGPVAGVSAVSAQERLVRAGLAALAVAVLGGWIATQYVGVHVFAVAAPGLVGLGCGGAASLAAGGRPRRAYTAIGVLAGLLGAALAFRLQVGGGQDLFGPAGTVVPPYLAAVVGALAWPVVFGPPAAGADQRP